MNGILKSAVKIAAGAILITASTVIGQLLRTKSNESCNKIISEGTKYIEKTKKKFQISNKEQKSKGEKR